VFRNSLSQAKGTVATAYFMVEAAGIEPASEDLKIRLLRTYPVI